MAASQRRMIDSLCTTVVNSSPKSGENKKVLVGEAVILAPQEKIKRKKVSLPKVELQ